MTLKETREEIRGLDDAALKAKIAEQQTALQRLKFSHAISQIENPSSIRDAKRMVARLKTEQRARQIAKSK
ncbi:50S ribosomal protein L29 [Bernardetia sp.]|uniref:50S ribosomal protein L29 n=1 Tax=Bernardetia sp. TaxID=1937974 RepID=UPI0025C2318D|nr:50S ribosomal protein L29 [Bernardetia sp.]